MAATVTKDVRHTPTVAFWRLSPSEDWPARSVHTSPRCNTTKPNQGLRKASQPRDQSRPLHVNFHQAIRTEPPSSARTCTLAVIADRESLHAHHGCPHHHRSNYQLPHQYGDAQPSRNGAVDQHADCTHHEQHTIDRWVEDGSKGRNLIELSRKPTIHPIGHPKTTKQQGCSGSFIFGEQQIQEQRKYAQPCKSDEVWNAEHSRPH